MCRRGQEAFEKNRERILDRDRLRFLPSPSTTRRSKRKRSKRQRKKKLRIKRRKGSRLAKSGRENKIQVEEQGKTRRGNFEGVMTKKDIDDYYYRTGTTVCGLSSMLNPANSPVVMPLLENVYEFACMVQGILMLCMNSVVSAGYIPDRHAIV